MPKSKKETINSPKIYHGTNEIIAKSSCSMGLPIDPETEVLDYGNPRSIVASSGRGTCLTVNCPGLMAFDSVCGRDKWGVVEIDVSHLLQENFMPHELFLAEKAKTKPRTEEERLKKLGQIRVNLHNHQKKWRQSLGEIGFCVYGGKIPTSAVSKVVVYDPASNPYITKAMIGWTWGSYESNAARQRMLTRWMIGENITPEEWMGEKAFSELTHACKDKVQSALRNKNGLDIFYIGEPNGKKINWW